MGIPADLNWFADRYGIDLSRGRKALVNESLKMEYHTVFDIANSGFGSMLFVLPGLLFIVIGTVMVTRRHQLSRKAPTWFASCFPFFFLGFSILWTLLAGLATGGEQWALRRAYADGRYKVVEGVVENFVPMPKEGHSSESFTVSGVRFEYSDYRVTAGFNNTRSHGGPITEGLPVRISYHEDIILKLEVGKPVVEPDGAASPK